ncbi:UPF0246 protein [Cellulomonas soli]|uniref:UPF0246 protein n=1 Tax=Cellulomonas soli TaxID=931535 RepID=A0A512P9K7_9CELL|nr:UPF0246 protein [Cellulomonas soli]
MRGGAYSRGVLVLLPPSEGKTAPPATGPTLDLHALSSPALTEARERVLDALVQVSGRPGALEVLGVGPGLAAEVARNVHLRTAPTAPARRVYTGVLYAAAGLDRLTPTQRERAASTVRIVSGLWGAVTPDDPIPAYRLSMGTTLTGVGGLAAAWRDHLGSVLDPRAEGDLVVDCRSATYAAAWRPPSSAHRVAVQVLREQAGTRTVVSHHAKHTRGVLTRHLLTRRGKAPHDADTLAAAAAELIGTSLGTAGGAGPGTAASSVLAVELGPTSRTAARVLSLVVS